jgi:hypothetical protein
MSSLQTFKTLSGDELYKYYRHIYSKASDAIKLRASCDGSFPAKAD